MTPDDLLLSVRDLTIAFPQKRGADARIVEGVSLDVTRGETLGIVGESGSGKTMTALACMGLVPRPGRVEGRILIEGRDIVTMRERALRDLRGGEIGMIFQDPMSGFNPVRTIGDQIIESIRRHRRVDRAEARRRATEALRDVGIPSPEARMEAYPHQLSGGLRQRCMIALAMVNHPKLILADEPTTALDATIQLQVLDLLKQRVRAEGNAALILVTHDFGVAAEICDHIAVMYHGRIVEIGTAEALLTEPRHPYTAALLRLVPTFDPERKPLDPIPGMPPPATEVIPGCSFRPRCPRAVDACAERPPLDGPEDNLFACWNPVPEDQAA